MAPSAQGMTEMPDRRLVLEIGAGHVNVFEETLGGRRRMRQHRCRVG